MEYIASISYGKDSLAMLEVIARHGLPLDRIVHVEIMATRDIPADLPELTAWKKQADETILARYGIPVEHISADVTYEDLFYKIPKRRENSSVAQGKILGFPSLRSQWCSKALKVLVMRKLNKADGTVQYIGIAANEPARFGQLSDRVRSPLVDYGVTEEDCIEICGNIGLLAPTYLQSKRSGCWFCHAQPVQQLRLLRKQHPELWEKLLQWDADSPIPFRHKTGHDAHSVHDFEKRFRMEDTGELKEGDPRFKWSQVIENGQDST